MFSFFSTSISLLYIARKITEFNPITNIALIIAKVYLNIFYNHWHVLKSYFGCPQYKTSSQDSSRCKLPLPGKKKNVKENFLFINTLRS